MGIFILVLGKFPLNSIIGDTTWHQELFPSPLCMISQGLAAGVAGTTIHQ